MSLFKRISSRLVAGAISIALYIPIIAGLITPMVWVLAAWYFSWDILGFIVPFSETWGGFCGLVPIVFPEEIRGSISLILGVLMVAAFCIGLFLLLYGLVTLARARVNDEGLVKHGPYSWVRHPQHLGILLMLFLMASPPWRLYWPYTFLTRPGDVITMTSVAFLLILVADLEDYWLAKEYGDNYTQYCQEVPFILPKQIPLPKFPESPRLARGHPLRYPVVFIIFWILLVLLSYYFTFVPLLFTR